MKKIKVKLLKELHPLLAERILILSEVESWIDYFLEEPKVNISLFRDLDKEFVKEILKETIKAPFEELEEHLRLYARDRNLKPGEVFRPIRIAISGKEISLPLFESMKIIGEEKCKERIKSLLHQI